MLSSIFNYRCLLALNPPTFWLHSFVGIVCYKQGNRTIFIGYGSGNRTSISIKIWTEFRFSEYGIYEIFVIFFEADEAGLNC